MNRQLPDVNVLLALLWPRHVNHAAAHAWFAESGHRAWATNILTQLGFLRLLTNPAVTHGIVTATSAWEALREATSHAGHEFWPWDHAAPSAIELMVPRITGHQQWTDATLLCHAIEHKGVFVTFDSGVRELAAGSLRNHLLLLRGK
jgi:uncharacterized protein